MDAFWTVWSDYLSFIVCFAAATLLFSFYLPRRSLFPLRAFGVAAVWAGAAIVLNVINLNLPAEFTLVFGYFRFTLQYLIVLFGVWFCYDCGFFAAMFCSTNGYCIQHIVARISTIMGRFIGGGRPVKVVVLLGCLLVVLAAVWLLAIRGKERAYRDMTINSPIQLIITTFALTFMIFVDIRIIFLVADLADAGDLLLYVFAISAMCALVTLMLEINLLSKKHITDDFKELQKLLGDEREEYKQEKFNVEMINLKCHDIRHQIRALEGQMDAAAVRELADTVNIYSASVKTGNEAVDVVLAKQGLYCLKNNIRLTCLLDGTKLNFIPDHELYALFGNALENAVRAVEKLDAEKRVISIAEKSAGDLTNITFTNYYAGSISFDEGLPVSKRENHGFGTRSMRMIVEKYGGRLTAAVKDDLFILNMFFPLRQAGGG